MGTRLKHVLAKFRGLHRDGAGLAALEMALVTPLILLILGGVIDLGRNIWYQTEVSVSLRAGMQYALVNSTDALGIQNVITTATALPPAQFTVPLPTYACTCSDGSAITCVANACGNGNPTQWYVTMGATFSYTPLLGTAGGMLPSSVSKSATLRTQ